MQQRHFNLRVRIREDDDHQLWFTTEGVQEIPVEVVDRESDRHWIEVCREAAQIPFEFETRPAIRFILVHSPAVSELVILCHHILCDGLSLAYLARDLMTCLGEPDRALEALPDPAPISPSTMPPGISLNPIARFFIRRLNRKWEAFPVFFDQEDYQALSEAYWERYHHQMLTVEMTEEQTSALVERCRKENVTVNSALATAFAGANYMARNYDPRYSSIGVAASLRDRLQQPVGEVMGFYAGLVNLKFKYDDKTGFWENARQLHRKLKPRFTDKNLFQDPAAWFHLDSAILEAIHFKRLGGLVSPQSSRYQKLSTFGHRNDVVLSLLKRDKMDSPDEIIMGTAVTNLTRMDFPTRYGSLELDRLFLKPGGAFPQANVGLVLGAVTCAGKLSLVVEYAQEATDTRTMETISERAMAMLLDE